MPLDTIFIIPDQGNFAVNKNTQNELALYNKISGPAIGQETADLSIAQKSNTGDKDVVKMGIRLESQTTVNARSTTNSHLLYGSERAPFESWSGTTLTDVVFGQYVLGNTWNSGEETESVEFFYTESIASVKMNFEIGTAAISNISWRWLLIDVENGNAILFTSATFQTGTTLGVGWEVKGTGFRYSAEGLSAADITDDLVANLPVLYSN